MNDKEILAGAPEGATHWDGSYYYIVNEDAKQASKIWNVISPYRWHESGNLRLNDLIEMRSLADIARVVELEKERDELSAFKVIFGMGDGESVVTARQYINNLKLEQQAKGIEDFVADYKGTRMDFSQAERLIVNLRTQAKQLGVE